MVSRYRERRPKWSIAKIDAQTEQEDSFRRLIGLAKIAKRARINQMAKDSAKSLAPDIGNVPMINRETSDPPFKSIFTSTAGKIIPDYIERPVSDVARKTVGGAYNLVADVLPEHIFATASQATGLKFGDKTERVKRALDKFRDDTGVDLSYYYNLTSPGGVASNIAGMATGGPTPVDAFSPQQLKRLSELVTEVKDIRQERPWYAQVGMSVANPVEWVGGAAVGRGLASATARASTTTLKGVGKGAKVAKLGAVEPKQFIGTDSFGKKYELAKKIMQWEGRNIALVKMADGKLQPFYRRTGGGDLGKVPDPNLPAEGAFKGDWVPFDGLAPSGWFNKLRWAHQDINDPLFRYGTQEMKEIGKRLQSLDNAGKLKVNTPVKNIEDVNKNLLSFTDEPVKAATTTVKSVAQKQPLKCRL